MLRDGCVAIRGQTEGLTISVGSKPGLLLNPTNTRLVLVCRNIGCGQPFRTQLADFRRDYADNRVFHTAPHCSTAEDKVDQFGPRTVHHDAGDTAKPVIADLVPHSE